MIETFKAFMADPNAWDMFVDGRPGTGKTTNLAKMLEGVENYIVCAHTHQACDILRSKLPKNARVQTLHSYLKKRPTINVHATKVEHIGNNKVQGISEVIPLLVIDEYGVVGEQDLMDIRALQDEDYNGIPGIKIIWIGDPRHQLLPVGDMFTNKPYGKYQVVLTHVYRTDKSNPLSLVVDQLIDFLDGVKEPEPLIESEHFVRGQDIANPSLVRPCDSIILAYTNARVQQINALMEGKTSPDKDDILFSPTSRLQYIFGQELSAPKLIDLPFGGRQLAVDSKYKTLEHLHTMEGIDYCLATCDDEDYILAYVFGHQSYRNMLKHYQQLATESNKAIESKHKGYKAAAWARNNHTTKLARERSKAWRDFLTFDECVICLDFNHAMTVHKSQGSTYDTVYLDTNDIATVRERDYDLYLRLLCVGISRASNKVITN